MRAGRDIISLVAQRQDLDQFRKKNWEGTFEEYLDLVRETPRVTRNAFERVYDMILSYGTETYEEFREKRTRYLFFRDPDDGGRDAVFGLDNSLGRWSTPSRAPPRATESKSACCCCTVRSEVARAPLPGC